MPTVTATITTAIATATLDATLAAALAAAQAAAALAAAVFAAAALAAAALTTSALTAVALAPAAAQSTAALANTFGTATLSAAQAADVVVAAALAAADLAARPPPTPRGMSPQSVVPATSLIPRCSTRYRHYHPKSPLVFTGTLGRLRRRFPFFLFIATLRKKSYGTLRQLRNLTTGPAHPPKLTCNVTSWLVLIPDGSTVSCMEFL